MSGGESDVLFLILTHMEEDACTFWAQRHSPTIKLDLEHVTTRLQKLSMAKAPRVNDPIENKLYGCEFIDECWYRCRVLFPITKSKCLVQYVDYGNCEEKNQLALVDIPIDLQQSSMPCLAHRYRLHNVHIEPENLEKVRKYIETKCSDDFVKANLVSKPNASPMEVILYDEDGVSICEQLIKAGLAVDIPSSKTKRNIIMSSPERVISQAQRYRNPLLSSSDEEVNNNKVQRFPAVRKKLVASSQSSGIDSMQESCGGPDGFGRAKKKFLPECGNCQVNKEMADRIRLSMIKLNHDLAESEHSINSMVEKEEYWKKKYMQLKEEQIRAETAMAVVMQPQKKIERTDQKEKERVTPTKVRDTAIKKPVEVRPKEAVPEKPKVTSPPKTPRMDTGIAAKTQMDEMFAKSTAIMKKVILPTYEFTKKLVTSNKTIDDYLKYDQDLKEVVGKIKAYLDKDGSLISDQYFALISRRNAVLQDLKQTIRSTIPLVTTAADVALKEKVANYLTQLKKTLSENTSNTIKVDDTAVAITDVCELIQKWKTDKENGADLSGVIHKLMSCLSQQSEKYYRAKDLSAQARATQEEISTLESQEKTIKQATDEMKAIRRRRQKIRLLVAELKNLEEEEKDSDDSEKEFLKKQRERITKDLTAQRKELQECFENKWVVMESLADMVEKFSPELHNEHPELGIDEYIKGKGIVMKDMEVDHFDVKRVEMDKNLNVEILHTEYRAEPIMLHKYPSHAVSEKSWNAVLQYIAIYTNVGSPNAIIPIGVFKEKDAVYVMVSAPQYETFPVLKSDKTVVSKIVKDIAAALSVMHSNGITHGQLSKNMVSFAMRPNVHGYLSVPNFFRESGNAPLAEDIRQFGLLAKSLLSDAPFPKLQVAIENCLKNSATMSMMAFLDAY